jgi:hypothetical protein
LLLIFEVGDLFRQIRNQNGIERIGLKNAFCINFRSGGFIETISNYNGTERIGFYDCSTGSQCLIYVQLLLDTGGPLYVYIKIENLG